MRQVPPNGIFSQKKNELKITSKSIFALDVEVYRRDVNEGLQKLKVDDKSEKVSGGVNLLQAAGQILVENTTHLEFANSNPKSIAPLHSFRLPAAKDGSPSERTKFLDKGLAATVLVYRCGHKTEAPIRYAIGDHGIIEVHDDDFPIGNSTEALPSSTLTDPNRSSALSIVPDDLLASPDNSLPIAAGQNLVTTAVTDSAASTSPIPSTDSALSVDSLHNRAVVNLAPPPTVEANLTVDCTVSITLSRTTSASVGELSIKIPATPPSLTVEAVSPAPLDPHTPLTHIPPSSLPRCVSLSPIPGTPAWNNAQSARPRTSPYSPPPCTFPRFHPMHTATPPPTRPQTLAHTPPHRQLAPRLAPTPPKSPPPSNPSFQTPGSYSSSPGAGTSATPVAPYMLTAPSIQQPAGPSPRRPHVDAHKNISRSLF